MSRITSGRRNGTGRPKGYDLDWRPQTKTRVLLEQVSEILAEYRTELPLTARQIFYRLVGAYGYPKNERAYERLCYYLGRARRARIIPFESMRDDGASVLWSHHYDDDEDFHGHIHRLARRFERNKLARQEANIRVYCEAAGMMPQLHRVSHRYSVPVYSCSGFDSLTAKHDLAESVSSAFTYEGKPTMILHLGDYDPSGENIFDVIAEDVGGFVSLNIPHKAPGEVATFERVALTPNLIHEYDLPTSPPKGSDSRSKAWGGRGTCQLEALRPDVLAGLLTDAIEAHLDLDILAADREAEPEDRRRLARQLPAGGVG